MQLKTFSVVVAAFLAHNHAAADVVYTHSDGTTFSIGDICGKVLYIDKSSSSQKLKPQIKVVPLQSIEAPNRLLPSSTASGSSV